MDYPGAAFRRTSRRTYGSPPSISLPLLEFLDTMNRKNVKGGGKKPRVEVVFDPDARK